METTRLEVLEQKLNQAVRMAVYFQCIAALALGFILYFEPVGYRKIALVFSLSAFGTSLFLSKLYSDAEKQLGQSKLVRPKSAGRKFNERFLLVYFPYTCWCPIIGVFLGK